MVKCLLENLFGVLRTKHFWVAWFLGFSLVWSTSNSDTAERHKNHAFRKCFVLRTPKSFLSENFTIRKALVPAYQFTQFSAHYCSLLLLAAHFLKKYIFTVWAEGRPSDDTGKPSAGLKIMSNCELLSMRIQRAQNYPNKVPSLWERPSQTWFYFCTHMSACGIHSVANLKCCKCADTCRNVPEISENAESGAPELFWIFRHILASFGTFRASHISLN